MSRQQLIVLGVALGVILIVSGIRPFDRATWLLEVFPVIIALPVLVFTYQRFPLSSLLYLIIFVHAVVLIVGGVYTYARVPFGFWLQDAFELARNPYDKIGHFMQGFVPALVAREIFLRGKYVSGRKMAAFLSVCVALAVSSFYEMIEWWTALAFGQGAEDFLGTQGDVWDTQSDMFLALIGSTTGLLLLASLQDRQIAKLRKSR